MVQLETQKPHAKQINVMVWFVCGDFGLIFKLEYNLLGYDTLRFGFLRKLRGFYCSSLLLLLSGIKYQTARKNRKHGKLFVNMAFCTYRLILNFFA